MALRSKMTVPIYIHQERNQDFIHLRLTESLLRALESVKKERGSITLVCDEQQNLKIVVNTTEVEEVYELECEHSSTYLTLATVEKSAGEFLGDINYKYRTKATSDSFVKARENLVKEVENTRQQKLEVLDYQLKVASSLRDKRNTKTERNLQRNSVSKPALKKLKVSETENVTRMPATRSKISRKLDVTPKMTNRGSQKLSGITSPSTPICPVKRAKTRVKSTEQKATVEKDPLKEIEAVIHRKCVSAIRKRQRLEQRLCKAYKTIDEKKRDKELEKIKADLCAFVDELYNDELLRKWIPVPVESV